MNAPIESLQHMLRSIAYLDGDIQVVNTDGIFCENTKKAVMEFQNKYGLPVTGVVDRQTHTAIVDVYETADALLRPAESSVIHYPARLVILEQQYHPYIYLVQTMFNALHHEFPSYIITSAAGILDPSTVSNLRLLQNASELPQTGNLDKQTWDALNLLFRGMFDRNYPISQG